MTYGLSRLAKLRKAVGLTQESASALLGIKHKQHLCGVENGWTMASPELMRAMQDAYKVSAREILAAAVHTFSHGRIASRQRARRKKLRLPQK